MAHVCEQVLTALGRVLVELGAPVGHYHRNVGPDSDSVWNIARDMDAARSSERYAKRERVPVHSV